MSPELQSPYIDRRVVDMSGVDPNLLRDLEQFKRDFRDLINAWGLTLVDRPDNPMIHHFSPSENQPGDGLSAVAMIMESDATIHTWPEKGFAAADTTVCVENSSMNRLHEELIPRYRPEKLVISKTGGMEIVHHPELITIFSRISERMYRAVELKLKPGSISPLEEINFQQTVSGGLYIPREFSYEIPLSRAA